MSLSSRLRSATIAAGLLITPWLCARAADSASPLTATSAAEEALRANPDLAAAYAAIEAARGRLLQAGLWPNPELVLAGRSDFAFGNDGERTLGADIAQRFPIAGRLSRAQDVSRVDVALALAEARDFERTLIGDVQRTVYGLLALDEAVASREAVLRTAGELARASARRFKAAEVSEADVGLLEIELARFEQEKRLLELERATASVRLNQLLNRPATAAIPVSGQLEVSAFDATRAADAAAQAGKRRPDLEQVRLESDRARADARLAHAESWEDWTVGAGYENDRQVFANEPRSDPIGVKQDEFLGLSVRVPLPLWNRNQGRVAEAHANERRARARLVALERAVEAEIETARRRVEELSRVTREYDEALLPRSERTVQLLEKGYRQGLVPITTLVQAEQQLADTVLRRARTLGELRQAEIDLETSAAASPLLDRPSPDEENRP
jgi:cobalt-zinc-cadmium efflux system outer membrane protein